jgi:hypothetical protein
MEYTLKINTTELEKLLKEGERVEVSPLGMQAEGYNWSFRYSFSDSAWVEAFGLDSADVMSARVVTAADDIRSASNIMHLLQDDVARQMALQYGKVFELTKSVHEKQSMLITKLANLTCRNMHDVTYEELLERASLFLLLANLTSKVVLGATQVAEGDMELVVEGK